VVNGNNPYVPVKCRHSGIFFDVSISAGDLSAKELHRGPLSFRWTVGADRDWNPIDAIAQLAPAVD
jgi:hypothetical protein